MSVVGFLSWCHCAPLPTSAAVLQLKMFSIEVKEMCLGKNGGHHFFVCSAVRLEFLFMQISFWCWMVACLDEVSKTSHLVLFLFLDQLLVLDSVQSWFSFGTFKELFPLCHCRAVSLCLRCVGQNPQTPTGDSEKPNRV